MRELILKRVKELLRYEVDGQTYYADDPDTYNEQSDLDLLKEYEEMLLDTVRPPAKPRFESKEELEAFFQEIVKENSSE
jgi:hypothetical protein